ncbi:MAG TPA: hypothetical protein VE987_05715 [Polyangiaceae bacterium]|nr:hypothetical protein [Polyangiaceae bacterium]
MLLATEHAIEDGLRRAVNRRLERRADKDLEEAEREVVKQASDLVEDQIKERAEKMLAEDAKKAIALVTLPVAIVFRVGSLLDAIAVAGIKVTEARLVAELAKEIGNGFTAHIHRVIASVEALPAEDAIALARDARVETSAEEIADEFEQVVVRAEMITHRPAWEAVDEAQAILHGRRRE